MTDAKKAAEEWADKCVGASWRSKAGWISCRDNFLVGAAWREQEIAKGEPDGWCAWHPEHGWKQDNIAGVKFPDIYGSKADAIEALSWGSEDERWRIVPVRLLEIKELSGEK